MIKEIRSLGFSNIEISHGTIITKMPGILKSYKNKEFNCCGVHNFFPSPVEITVDNPDVYEFSSYRKTERKRAINLTLDSINYAAKLDAKYLVLHMGSTYMNRHKWSPKLISLIKEKGPKDPAYLKFKEKFIKKRNKIAARYYNRAIDALEVISQKAKQEGILLAIESRDKHERVPTEEEMLQLQLYFKDNEHIGYWHDFGHTQIKHNLQLVDHEKHLDLMNPFIIGCHLHDVQWPERDHRVPFSGGIDYSALVRHIPNHLPFTWELSRSQKAVDIITAKKEWELRFPNTV